MSFALEIETGLPEEVVKLFDTAQVPISIAEARVKDLPLVYVNTAFEHLTGWQANEVIGQNCRFLQGSATNKDITDDLAWRCVTRQESSVCLVNYRRDQSLFYNVIALRPLKLSDGREYIFGCQLAYQPTFNLGSHTENANAIDKLWKKFRSKHNEGGRVNREADLFRLDAISMRFNAAAMLARNSALRPSLV